MRLSALGFGFLVLCSWSRQGKISWQSFAFQAISQRPLRQTQPYLSRRCPPYVHHSATNNDFASSNNSDDKEEPTKKLPLRSLTSSYQTALCVVPPDDAWDTIQRARHFADDKTYHQWPPAIRLFHPFCPRSKLTNLALDLAKIIEKHNIEPFEITLNQWTVMPLPDTLQSMLEEQENREESQDDHGADYKDDPQYQETQALIASEERKGRVRKKIRDLRTQARLRVQEHEHGTNSANNNTQVVVEASSITNVVTDMEEEPEIMEAESETIQPRATFDEFNGPSMIAVEPDEESSRKLRQLRELIRRELLEAFDPSSPSASLWDSSVPFYDTEHDEEAFEEYVADLTSFRPLVPIGASPTIDAALATARKLKGFWDPLTFQITDLHFISQATASRQRIGESTEAYYSLNFDPAASVEGLPVAPFQDTKIQQIRDSGSAFGRDAVVMLMGEEIEMDDESNELLANLVWKEGTPGGFDLQDGNEGNDPGLQQEALLEEDEEGEEEDGYNSLYENYSRKLDAKEGKYDDLLDWLDGDEDEDDDDVDIGTDVVIGRTHMFSGEKRIYSGMPASSTAEETEGTFSIGNVFGGDFKI